MKVNEKENYLDKARRKVIKRWKTKNIKLVEEIGAIGAIVVHLVLGYFLLNRLTPEYSEKTQDLIPIVFFDDKWKSGVYEYRYDVGDISSIIINGKEYKYSSTTAGGTTPDYTHIYYLNGISTLDSILVFPGDKKTIPISNVDSKSIVKLKYVEPRSWFAFGSFLLLWTAWIVVAIAVACSELKENRYREKEIFNLPLFALHISMLIRLYYLLIFKLEVIKEAKGLAKPGSIERAEVELVIIETKTKGILADITSKIVKTKEALETVSKVDLQPELRDKLTIKLKAQLDWFNNESKVLQEDLVAHKNHFDEKLKYTKGIMSLREVLDAVQTAKDNDEFIRLAQNTITSLHDYSQQVMAILEERSSEVGNYVPALEEMNSFTQEAQIKALV